MNGKTHQIFARFLPLAGLFAGAAGFARADATADAEFFEKQVRPVLADNCFGCHGPAKQKAGLRLDSRAAILAGGEGGAVIEPGKHDASRLVSAIAYDNPDLQMPPKSKLPDAQIAAIRKWIEMGAPWPASDAAPAPGDDKASEVKTFDLEGRRKAHWAWQPIAPPNLPIVANPAWIHDGLDFFILARLEAEGLRPAPEAEKSALLRRVTFDITGLPPTRAEIDAFLADSSPNAYERIVDRLLASPRYGERWARHWLDLVRYAESYGHEQDFLIANAWQYRDYLIRAFNADVPYDQFVTEHVAGDLLPAPRLNPELRFNESIIATGFWHLGQATHAPVDALSDEADRIDNQIDVFSKTFLGMTVSCARCHDHKFDAIATRDYYSLFGYLKSSRRQVALLDPDGAIKSGAAELEAMRRGEGIARMHAALDTARALKSPGVADHLLAAREVLQGAPRDIDRMFFTDADPWPRNKRPLALVAAEFNLDPARLGRWIDLLTEPASQGREHPLMFWRRLADAPLAPGERFEQRLKSASDVAQLGRHTGDPDPFMVFADFSSADFGAWTATGEAFGAGPTREGDWSAVTGAPVAPGIAHSGLAARRLKGALRSPTFTFTKNNIHIRAAGEGSVIRIVIDHFNLREQSALLFDGAQLALDTGGAYQWFNLSKDLNKYIGHRAYIEIIDDGDGYAAVDEIRFSDGAPPADPGADSARVAGALAGEGAASATLEDAARAYDALAREGLAHADGGGAPGSAFAALLLGRDLIDLGDAGRALAEARRASHARAAQLPEPMRAPAMADGNGEDVNIYIRGGSKTQGDPAPRQFLSALGGGGLSPDCPGSGRLDLARRMLDPADPLPARVMVNRVWHHLFGRGIVPTVDNFGVLGEAPSHPELLDYLAGRFRNEGWSLKRLIREIALSSTYRMASRNPDPAAQAKDPANRLLARMNIKRLEGEAIRDALLAASGRLDPAMFGPPVPLFVTPFMDGRNKPEKSGPLDGAGRRSVYQEIRRNYLPPMLLAFDLPVPDTTLGRRNISNVPAQALIMMNDPLVKDQAALWTRRIIAETPGATPDVRLERMYLEALGRKPSPAELYRALAFLRAQEASYVAELIERGELTGPETIHARAWTDLAHAVFMLKEFIFVG